MSELKNRYEFVFFFDVKDGNPNGDPDLGNQPRMDPETGHGLVTDVCLKRKVRNFVMLSKEEAPGYKIFIKEKAILNNLISESWDKAAQAADQTEAESKKDSILKKQDVESEARSIMCREYYDIRTFGAVLSTGKEVETSDKTEDKKQSGKGNQKIRKNAGQVRGPVQFTFARSIDPIIVAEHAITRMAVTREEDAQKGRTIGRKYTVPYGLYRMYGFVSPQLAAQTEFTEEDLNLLWEALLNMFDLDRSAARGLMSARRLIIFRHNSALGNAPAEALFDRVECKRKAGVEIPRSFNDYSVTLDGKELTAYRTEVSVG